jgi:DNA polymerase III subunit epsilon
MTFLKSNSCRSIDLLNYFRQISSQTFTVVDVETTGSHPSYSRVIEISVLHANVTDGIQEHRTDLINPQVQVPQNITQFTGITQQMVLQAPFTEEVLPNYFPLLNAHILTAHHLAFDYGFLQSEYQHLGINFARPVAAQLCTVELARLLLADLPSRRLPYLVKYFGFDVGRSHRAKADTLACWLLAQELFHRLQAEPDQILLNQFAQQQITLEQAADLLRLTPDETQLQLQQAKIRSRVSKRSGSIRYRRGDVETLLEP